MFLYIEPAEEGKGLFGADLLRVQLVGVCSFSGIQQRHGCAARVTRLVPVEDEERRTASLHLGLS